MASPKITITEQRKIEVLLKSWKGKLTWDILIKKCLFELNISISRQALCSYTGIYKEYMDKKALLRGVVPGLHTKLTKSDLKTEERIERLQATIEILTKKNSEQLRLIERIFMNASEMTDIDLHKLVQRRSEENS